MSRNLIASDNFNRADGSPGSDWQQLNPYWGSVSISSNQITGSVGHATERPCMRWVGGGTFNADQYASLRISQSLPYQSSNYGLGVIARASGDINGARDFYFAIVLADSPGPNYTTQLGKVVNGTVTVLHSAAIAWSLNDRIELEVEGTTLRLCKNGVPLGGSFTQTDTSLSSGQPGVVINELLLGDDWEAGNMTSFVPEDNDTSAWTPPAPLKIVSVW